MTEPSSSFTKLVRRDVGSSLIFLAEGYAAHERDAFLGDVRRLYDEVLGSPDAPLRHVSAFFSVDAIFVPSATSGVPRLATRGAKRGGTAFGLYRDAAQPLRLRRCASANRTFAFASDLDFAKLEFSVSGGVGVDAYVDGVRADVAYKTPPTADRRFAEARVALGRRRRHAVTLSATETARAAAAAPWHPAQMVCHVQACFCPVCRDLLLRRVVARAGGLFGRRGSGLAPTVAEGAATRWFRQDLPGGAYAEEDPAARRPGCWRVVAAFASPAARGPLDVFESSATVAVDAPWSSSLIASSADTSVFTSSVNAKPPETKYFSGSSPAWEVVRFERARRAPLADAVDPAARGVKSPPAAKDAADARRG
ncbi:IgA peptidase M64 [Aureococcus anophagefferens]|nr:IgA peptidase M64 [Aureococcus anophagefferens]